MWPATRGTATHVAQSWTRIALVAPRKEASDSWSRMSTPDAVKTTASPAMIAAFSFCPALNRPAGGSGPRRLTAHASQARSSSSKRSSSDAVRPRLRGLAATTRTRPAQKPIAAPTWSDFHSMRSAASAANTGRYRIRPVAVMTRKVDATTQCAVRSARPNRRTYSVAVGAADPGVEVIAVLLPVAGHELRNQLDPREPLDVLVAVHLGDHEPHGRAVRPGEWVTVHVMGKHDARKRRLPQRERVDVGPLERDEVCIPGVGQRLDHVPQRLEAHALPMDAPHGPPGDAVKVGRLARGRESHQLVPAQRHGLSDVAADLQAVGRRVELRPRRADRVDPPAADRQDVLEPLRDDGPRRAERPRERARDPASGHQAEPAQSDHGQEGRSSHAMLRHARIMEDDP